MSNAKPFTGPQLFWVFRRGCPGITTAAWNDLSPDGMMAWDILAKELNRYIPIREKDCECGRPHQEYCRG